MRAALAPPAGNPTALAASVDRYEETERAIAQAADALNGVVTGGAGQTVDALNGQARAANTHLSKAHGRYQGTRSALRSFTVELAAFHAAANGGDRQRSTRRALPRTTPMST